MGLSMKKMLELQERRRIALETGGALLDYPMSQMIARIEGSSRLVRVLSGYTTVGDFLQADMSSIIGVPGLSTRTVASIQTGIDAMRAEAAKTKETADMSVGQRMLMHAAKIIDQDGNAAYDVVMRSGATVRSVFGIVIDGGIAHLRSGHSLSRTRDRHHMVDPADVVMVRPADAEPNAGSLLVACAKGTLNLVDSDVKVKVMLRSGGEIADVTSLEQEVDTVEIGTKGIDGVSHFIDVNQIIGISIAAN